MANQKTILVTSLHELRRDQILMYKSLAYTQICILYKGAPITEKLPANIQIIEYTTIANFNKVLNDVLTTYKNDVVIPYFSGDANSKYSIKTYNSTFGTTIDPNIFREKDEMMKFVGQVGEKQYFRTTYKELVAMDYTTIEEKIGKTFIIKPTNASASRSTFKVNSSEIFEGVKPKIGKNFDYMVEEYIDGELYSMDVFMDGENMFLLAYAREVVMIELADKQKFSQNFLEKYGDELKKHFNFILPIVYNVDFSTLAKMELSLLEELRIKLAGVKYTGVIHLEYKYDRVAKKIGFLEWGARYGGYRKGFLKKIYNTDHLRIPYYLLIEKDRSRFTQIKGKIFGFKEQEHNINLVRVKTNFIAPTNYITILEKTGNIFEISFQKFLKDYYRETFGLKIKKIDFYVEYTKGAIFHPFYKDPITKLDYIMELDDDNFTLFKRKKFKIIEQVFFHDYQ